MITCSAGHDRKTVTSGKIPCDPEIVPSANEVITRVIKTLGNHTRSQIKAKIWRSRFIKYITSYAQNTSPQPIHKPKHVFWCAGTFSE